MSQRYVIFYAFIFSQNKKKAQMVIRAFFEIIKKVRSDNQVLSYALAHLDGILEDSRSRVHHFINLMNDFKQPENLINILNSFIH